MYYSFPVLLLRRDASIPSHRNITATTMAIATHSKIPAVIPRPKLIRSTIRLCRMIFLSLILPPDKKGTRLRIPVNYYLNSICFQFPACFTISTSRPELCQQPRADFPMESNREARERIRTSTKSEMKFPVSAPLSRA